MILVNPHNRAVNIVLNAKVIKERNNVSVRIEPQGKVKVNEKYSRFLLPFVQDFKLKIEWGDLPKVEPKKEPVKVEVKEKVSDNIEAVDSVDLNPDVESPKRRNKRRINKGDEG